MQLQAYFDRIAYRGEVRPSPQVLVALLQAHICSVPFENLDVQLGQPVTTAPEAAFDKIVMRRRGGWCYEQNGLFGSVLTEIGFDVTRIAAAVMRQERGIVADANHLTLLVRCAKSKAVYLVDVGFGGSMISPIELKESAHEQPPFRIGLNQLEHDSWRFWEDLGKGRFGYDFNAQIADEAALARKCDFLQSDPSSGFVLNLVAQQRLPNEHKVLRGRVFSTATPDGRRSRTLDSSDELVATLAGEFSLDIPEAANLWPKITARHDELLRESEGGN